MVESLVEQFITPRLFWQHKSAKKALTKAIFLLIFLWPNQRCFASIYNHFSTLTHLTKMLVKSDKKVLLGTTVSIFLTCFFLQLILEAKNPEKPQTIEELATTLDQLCNDKKAWSEMEQEKLCSHIKKSVDKFKTKSKKPLWVMLSQKFLWAVQWACVPPMGILIYCLGRKKLIKFVRKNIPKNPEMDTALPPSFTSVTYV